MNITHAVSEEIKGDKLEAIFNRQKELMDKYHHIEERSGLLQTGDCPVNLDDKRGQARLKDFAWRVTEEVGEALDAIDDPEHFCEELIDGLHFLTELSILSGMNSARVYSEITKSAPDEDTDILSEIAHLGSYMFTGEFATQIAVAKLVETLGMTCNCLKNKPWKQSNMVTDKNKFYENLGKVWLVYIALLSLHLTPDEIADVYLKKSQVNKFRQRSNY